MTDFKNFYGFATFLLFDFTGQPTDGPHDYGTCYGHLGATYGWNSLAWFMPGLNFSMSVATNVESTHGLGHHFKMFQNVSKCFASASGLPAIVVKSPNYPDSLGSKSNLSGFGWVLG